MALLAVIAYITPAVVWAQGVDESGGIVELVSALRRILNLLVPLMMGVTLLWFFWQMTMLIAHAHDPEARKRGRRAMLVGIMVLTVMSSLWGIVAFIQEAFGLPTDQAIDIPIVVPQGGSIPLGR